MVFPDFQFRFMTDGLDENDTIHLGTFVAVRGNLTAPSGRGSPLHSLGYVHGKQRNSNYLNLPRAREAGDLPHL